MVDGLAFPYVLQVEFAPILSLTEWKSLQYSSSLQVGAVSHTFMQLSLVIWIHLIAVITFMGGLLYHHLVLRPVLQAHSIKEEGHDVLRKVGQRFRTVTWISLITLILTGAFNMLSEGGSARIETEWGVVLMLKLFLFAIAFALVLIHDFVIDPYASSSQSSSKTPTALGTIRRAALVQQAILVLTFIILFVAAYLTTM